MNNLKKLYLNDTKFKNLECLKDFKNLEVLYLDNTYVKDISLLMPLSNLKKISILDTDITVDDVNKLKKNLPGCKVYH